ncbi:condensation domain-containing protein [Streptomyces sp. ITFR-16]|uniref:condensation domain-containing protein n=1 Tax=Streptomyces sp. ITFR-16 TaxID=3075198 RepID=UPI00288C233A|nr:condensation domain-containing protein [Streptomyces sp. ITFR-16]WNI27245.1 condensation domain-containing protein [Streptomyces sp. ITFR-16]
MSEGRVDFVLAAVHQPVPAASGLPFELELCGPLGTGRAEAVAARVAQRHRAYTVTVDAAGTGRHTLRIAPTHGPPARPGAAVLADVLALAAGARDTVAAAGHQRDLIRAAVTGPADGHVGQLAWNWTGPIDLGRLADAWLSVADRETVLRASFDWTHLPRLVLHEWAEIEIAHLDHTAVSWSDLVERDRARSFAPHRPGLLRVTLLDGPPNPEGERPPTRVLLTYHRALLDERGVHLLLREFYRAYARGGVLPGGDRRPDVRDHALWLARQHTGAARAYWATAAPPPEAIVRPGLVGGRPTGHTGIGRVQRRLRPPQTARLRTWAAMRGAGESSALHVVWALLLYRAVAATAPAPVSFGVHLSGRDVPMEGAGGIPGLLGNPLPMTVTVDPGTRLDSLLEQARDAALDLAVHAWVPADRVRVWSGRDPDAELFGTGVVFDSRLELPEALLTELRGQGIQVDTPRSISAHPGLPLALAAHHDTDGGLALTAMYDRECLGDVDASALLSHCVRLLRSLPDHRDPRATVGEVLDLLDGFEVPRVIPRPPEQDGPDLVVLRPGGPAADVIVLVRTPGVPEGAYEALVRDHRGPERIVSLRAGRAAAPHALRQLLGPARRLVLCGAGPGGTAAYEIACTAGDDVVTAVVMTGVGSGPECARALATGLESVRAKSL